MLTNVCRERSFACSAENLALAMALRMCILSLLRLVTLENIAKKAAMPKMSSTHAAMPEMTGSGRNEEIHGHISGVREGVSGVCSGGFRPRRHGSGTQW